MRPYQKILGGKFLDWAEMDLRPYTDLTQPGDMLATFKIDLEWTLHIGTDKQYYQVPANYAMLYNNLTRTPQLFGIEQVKHWLENYENADMIQSNIVQSDFIHQKLDTMLNVAADDLGLDASSYDVQITVKQID